MLNYLCTTSALTCKKRVVFPNNLLYIGSCIYIKIPYERGLLVSLHISNLLTVLRVSSWHETSGIGFPDHRRWHAYSAHTLCRPVILVCMVMICLVISLGIVLTAPPIREAAANSTLSDTTVHPCAGPTKPRTLVGEIILGFNERYGPSNTNHSGVDVALTKDSLLYAPVAGTISYLGKVPAAARSGSVTAVTITTTEGYQVTLNPFAQTSIVHGQAVVKGQLIGTLSDTGDPSSKESHVHISLRIEGVYHDPSSLIGAVLDPLIPATITKTSQKPKDAIGPLALSPTPCPSTVPASTPAPTPLPVSIPEPASVPVPSMPASVPDSQNMPMSTTVSPSTLCVPLTDPSADGALFDGATAVSDATLSSARNRTTTHGITTIAGVHAAQFEESAPAAAATQRTLSARVSSLSFIVTPIYAWFGSLTTASQAALFFFIASVAACVVMAACAIINNTRTTPAYATSVHVRNMPCKPYPFVTRLFAAREEK